MTPIIQMTRLGNYGRLGNQLFQFAFLKAYAQLHNYRLEVSRWQGEELFNIKCDRPSITLPTLDKEQLTNQKNVDVIGYFQNSYCLSLYGRTWAKNLFKFNHNIIENTKHYPDKIVVHKRRGDYVGNPAFCTVSDKAYDTFIDKMGFKDVLFLDDSRPAELWLSDFITMMYAKVLIRSNSSFAWWAGTLGNAEVYSPVVTDKTGEHDDIIFIKGNHPRICDTRNIPGKTIHDDLVIGE